MLGIMSAMPEEIDALTRLLSNTTARERAGRRFIRGRLGAHEVVLVFSRWGKVAAASTATELLIGHGVTRVVFSGIAGAIDPTLNPGDVVIARELFHHDLDASPFFPQGEIPLLKVRGLPTHEELSHELLLAAEAFVREDLQKVVGERLRNELSLSRSRVVRADIASGDQVITTRDARDKVLRAVPTAACVEMEGAAAAQVCYEHNIPFACVRTISDRADEAIPEAVQPFFQGLAGMYTAGIFGRWLVL